MINFQIKKQRLTVPQYQRLRETTSWRPIPDEYVARAFRSDILHLCAFAKEGELLGAVRLVGDGAIYFYVQDLIVFPEYRGQGIGRELMKRLEAEIQSLGYKNSFIGLMAAEGTAQFYERFGYKKRPENAPGMCKYLEGDGDKMR